MQLIQIWKICSPVWMIYFVFWVFKNSILFTSYPIILYHDYLNKRTKYFEKIFNRSSCLGLMMMTMMMMMNFFCGMVDWQQAFSLISSRAHCLRSSPSRISDTPRAGFESAQNLSSGLVQYLFIYLHFIYSWQSLIIHCNR